ncbi:MULTISPECIES: APC family permease [Streptomyces]|uniref:APC family permease n=1 Tax=Streptomyces TaxID=1883 RepID=UPI0008E1C6E2|nr:MULTISPECIES: APC family permease [unclassified Streptomyces]SFN44771.1 amino acid/polyamine/organocation transporter, APC superfamily [Streptomyces sp. cf124]
MSASTEVAEYGLKRQLSRLNILQITINSIIGTGWLFSAMNAASIAGPAALLAWFVAIAILVLIAFNHAELGAMFSVAGGSARFVHYSHGTLAGFGIGWMAWIYGAATAPIEVQGVLSYAEGYTHLNLFHVDGTLTALGYGVAISLLAVFVVLNLFALKALGRVHNAVTWWKVGTILLVIVAILFARFEPSNFHSHGFAPYGFHGVLAAVAIGGIVFAYTGFEQAVQLGAETKNPGRNIPFAALATSLGLGLIAAIVYIDSVVSPTGNGIAYVTSTARVTYGMGRNGYIPEVVTRVDKRGVPVIGVIISFVVGLLCLLPFPSWQSLLGFLTSATAMLWAGVPIALGSLRRSFPDAARPFRLRPAGLWAPLGFAAANLLVYWTGWETDWKVFVAIAIGYAVFFINRAFQQAEERPDLDFRSSWWVWVWILGTAAISYMGTFGQASHPSGLGYLSFPFWDTAVMVAFSLAVYYLAIRTRLPAEKARQYAPSDDELNLTPRAGAAGLG